MSKTIHCTTFYATHKELLRTFKLYTRPSRAKPCNATAVTGSMKPNTPVPIMAMWNIMDTMSRPKWDCLIPFESSDTGDASSTRDPIISATKISSKEHGHSTNNKVTVCMKSCVNAKEPIDNSNTATTMTDE